MLQSLFFLCSAIAVQVAALDCYTPNGTSRNLMNGYSALQLYAPCNAGAKHSMCCKFGSSVTSGADQCIEDNMFCQGGGGGDVWRESCTDPTWQDPACKKLFVNGTGYPGEQSTNSSTDSGQIVTDVLITLCDDGVTYCSGRNNRACCVAKQGVYLDSAGIQRATDPNATSTTPITSAGPTSTGTGTGTLPSGTGLPTTTSTPVPASSSSGLSTGAKAGIGVGVAVAAVAVIGIVAFLLVRRKRRQSHSPPAPPTSAHDMKPQDPRMVEGSNTARPIYEAPTYSSAAEKVAGNGYTHRVELEGSSYPSR